MPVIAGFRVETEDFVSKCISVLKDRGSETSLVSREDWGPSFVHSIGEVSRTTGGEGMRTGGSGWTGWAGRKSRENAASGARPQRKPSYLNLAAKKVCATRAEGAGSGWMRVVPAGVSMRATVLTSV